MGERGRWRLAPFFVFVFVIWELVLDANMTCRVTVKKRQTASFFLK
jgi:hypothetical protein